MRRQRGDVVESKVSEFPLTDACQFGILQSGPGWRGPNAIRSVETAQVHHAIGRCCGLAARGARAATGDAGDWVSCNGFGRGDVESVGGFPQRAQRDWLQFALTRRRGDRVKRREFITLLGGAAATWPLAAHAQSPKMLRVGYSGMLPREAPHYSAFVKRMAELGYQEGRNFAFEYIQAPSIEGYELTYRELAARNVDILLAAGNEPALRAARAAAGTTPIVFIALDFDPVEKGYVASLSRPGNNSTGLFVSQLELAVKRVEFLRKTFPNARRIGLLWDAT